MRREPCSTASTRGKLVPTDVTNQEAFSFFLQDTWQAGRLTIRPGIRYERQNLSGVDPVGDNPDLCFEGDTRPGRVTAPDRRSVHVRVEQPGAAARRDLRSEGAGRAKVFASTAGSTRRSRTTSRRARCRPTRASRAELQDAALTQPVANGTLFAGPATNFHRPDSTRRQSILIPARPTRTNSWPAWSSTC